jgi:hypothetical protein
MRWCSLYIIDNAVTFQQKQYSKCTIFYVTGFSKVFPLANPNPRKKGTNFSVQKSRILNRII